MLAVSSPVEVCWEEAAIFTRSAQMPGHLIANDAERSGNVQIGNRVQV